jgi:hypothetical protein
MLVNDYDKKTQLLKSSTVMNIEENTKNQLHKSSTVMTGSEHKKISDIEDEMDKFHIERSEAKKVSNATRASDIDISKFIRPGSRQNSTQKASQLNISRKPKEDTTGENAKSNSESKLHFNSSNISCFDFAKIAYQLLIDNNEETNPYFKFQNSLISNISLLYNENNEIISFDYLEFTFLSLFKKDGQKPVLFYKIITNMDKINKLTWGILRSRLKEFIKNNLIGLTKIVLNNSDSKEEVNKEELANLIEDKFNDLNIEAVIDMLSENFKTHFQVGNVDKSQTISSEDMSLIFKNYEFLFEFVELRNFFIMKF